MGEYKPTITIRKTSPNTGHLNQSSYIIMLSMLIRLISLVCFLDVFWVVASSVPDSRRLICDYTDEPISPGKVVLRKPDDKAVVKLDNIPEVFQGGDVLSCEVQSVHARGTDVLGADVIIKIDDKEYTIDGKVFDEVFPDFQEPEKSAVTRVTPLFLAYFVLITSAILLHAS